MGKGGRGAQEEDDGRAQLVRGLAAVTLRGEDVQVEAGAGSAERDELRLVAAGSCGSGGGGSRVAGTGAAGLQLGVESEQATLGGHPGRRVGAGAAEPAAAAGPQILGS